MTSYDTFRERPPVRADRANLRALIRAGENIPLGDWRALRQEILERFRLRELPPRMLTVDTHLAEGLDELIRRDSPQLASFGSGEYIPDSFPQEAKRLLMRQEEEDSESPIQRRQRDFIGRLQDTEQDREDALARGKDAWAARLDMALDHTHHEFAVFESLFRANKDGMVLVVGYPRDLKRTLGAIPWECYPNISVACIVLAAPRHLAKLEEAYPDVEFFSCETPTEGKGPGKETDPIMREGILKLLSPCLSLGAPYSDHLIRATRKWFYPSADAQLEKEIIDALRTTSIPLWREMRAEAIGRLRAWRTLPPEQRKLAAEIITQYTRPHRTWEGNYPEAWLQVGVRLVALDPDCLPEETGRMFVQELSALLHKTIQKAEEATNDLERRESWDFLQKAAELFIFAPEVNHAYQETLAFIARRNLALLEASGQRASEDRRRSLEVDILRAERCGADTSELWQRYRHIG